MSPAIRETYLDNHASTRCDPRVVEAMIPYFVRRYANPSSSDHQAGLRAKKAVDQARSGIADLLRCAASELVFTSGATESNNLAILGTAHAGHGRRTILVSAIEHKSVLAPAAWLAARHQFKLQTIPVAPSGRVDLAALSEMMSTDVLLVSVQLANNEIGTLQDVREIALKAHSVGALAHSDIVQAVGRIPVDLRNLGLDLASISAHKLYGPKGVGALFVRGGQRSSRIAPITFGGDQENGLRPGTLNVPAIVGFGVAATIARGEIDQEGIRLALMRDQLEKRVLQSVAGSRTNGDRERRLPGNSSITLPVEADVVLARARDLTISSGSACNTSSQEPSTVLSAIGLTARQAASTIRVGLGRFTSPADVDLAADRIVQTVIQTIQEGAGSYVAP